MKLVPQMHHKVWTHVRGTADWLWHLGAIANKKKTGSAPSVRAEGTAHHQQLGKGVLLPGMWAKENASCKFS